MQTPEEIAARSALDAEKSVYWQRVFAQQRTQVETSKLVATVVLALAGTLVGTTMQVQPRRALDIVACVLIAVGLAGVLALVALDRLDEPNVDALSDSTEPDERILRDILIAHRTCLESNEETISGIKKIMTSSTLASLAAACVAVASLLGK